MTDSDKVWMPDTFFRNEKIGRFHKILQPNLYVRVFPDGDVLYRYLHISTKTSKPGPVAFCEIEIYSFEVFGTFQLSFAYQSATKAVQSGQK